MADRIGFIDFIRDRQILGWALDRDDPEQPVRVEIAVDSSVLGTVVADQERADLISAQIGTGRHGFAFTISPVFPVSRRSIVRARFADQPLAIVVPEDAEIPEDARVRFDPAAISIYANSWRVGREG